MKTRLFYTTGKEDILEMNWDKPEPTANQIEVKNILTGVCRSDIDMYRGDFHLPSRLMQGHEGLGQVTKVGKECIGWNVKEGDFVATRGEPSFADYYNAEAETFVVVPDADPKYIIEPVACAINLFESVRFAIEWNDDILILGTGFLARVLYETIRHAELNENNIVVVGNANKAYWRKQDVELYASLEQVHKNKGAYNYIFDLSDKPEYMTGSLDHIADCATIILAAEKHPAFVLPMGPLLWKSAQILMPSPRSELFIDAMEEAVCNIADGIIDPSSMWTRGYDRETEVKAAFEDGLNRTEGYQRGYIRW